MAYTSVLKRAIRTLWTVLDEMDLMWIPVHRSWRLNERHYGALQGLNKAETAAKFGEEQVKIWRRSYDIPPPALTPDDERFPGRDPRYREPEPGGAAAHRVPEGHGGALPAATGTRPSPRPSATGSKVLIAAHGNSLRALVKYLDNISEQEIVGAEHPHRDAAGVRARRRPEAAQPLLPGRSREGEGGHGSRGGAGQEEVSRAAGYFAARRRSMNLR